ncbi:MAG: SUMF1/EgtB/PvdO family nonheme iron enzyme [Candidatus Limnocylindrales bacterium]
MAHRLPRHAVLGVLASMLVACGGTPTPTAAPATQSPASAPVVTTASATVPAATAAATAPTAVSSPARDPGTARTDPKGIGQVWVPGGVFTMGSDAGSATPPSWAVATYASEHPAHEVHLTRGYWIDTTEVTVEAFKAFKDAGGYTDQSNWSEKGWAWLQGMGAVPLPNPCLTQKAAEPQVCVTWYEAEAYAHWRGGRLPTEAEWEFAARGAESRVYPWGDTFDGAKANLDGGTGPVAVGGFPDGASWIGALDMAGNAMEWVADWWSDTYYAEGVRDDPTGPDAGVIKIEKGGWWGPPDGTGSFVARSSFRLDEDFPTYQDHHIGFRIVATD